MNKFLKSTECTTFGQMMVLGGIVVMIGVLYLAYDSWNSKPYVPTQSYSQPTSYFGASSFEEYLHRCEVEDRLREIRNHQLLYR
jgi:hypothetical protein